MLKSIASISALILIVIVAGCGGGDDTSTTAAALSKPEFIKRADAICLKTDKTQEADYRAYAKKNSESLSTPAGLEKLVVVVGLPPVQAEAEQLAALGAPSGDEKEIDAIVSGIEAAVEEARQDPGSVEERRGSPFEEVDRMARKYGFEACAEAL